MLKNVVISRPCEKSGWIQFVNQKHELLYTGWELHVHIWLFFVADVLTFFAHSIRNWLWHSFVLSIYWGEREYDFAENEACKCLWLCQMGISTHLCNCLYFLLLLCTVAISENIVMYFYNQSSYFKGLNFFIKRCRFFQAWCAIQNGAKATAAQCLNLLL